MRSDVVDVAVMLNYRSAVVDEESGAPAMTGACIAG